MGTRRHIKDINEIVIHCSATPNGRAHTIEDIDRWHGERQPPFTRDLSIAPKHQPHLKHIGYHFVIELDGAVRAGRPLIETGAHVAGRNQNTIGICLVGTDRFTHEQWQALRTLVQNLRATPELALRQLTLSGHNQYSSKACPGFNVMAWEEMRFITPREHLLEAA